MRLVLLLLLIISGLAETYHVNPATGKMSNDGSAGSPWSRLDSVYFNNEDAAFVSGDTVLLYSGEHGGLGASKVLAYHQYDTNNHLVIKAAPGNQPLIAELHWRGCRGITLDSLVFKKLAGYTQFFAAFLSFYPDVIFGDNFLVKNCTFTSTENYSVYGHDSLFWADSVRSGLYSDASDIVIDNNTFIAAPLMNIRYGPATITNNVIDGFTEDAIKIEGSDYVIRNNVIKNYFDVKPTAHPDGIVTQCCNQGYPQRNIVVDRNTILQQADTTGTLDYYSVGADPPLAPIGIDLYGDSLVVTNNVVSITGPHAIYIQDFDSLWIMNNTAVRNDTSGYTPGFRVISGAQYEQRYGKFTMSNNFYNLLQWENADADSGQYAENNVLSTSFAPNFVDATKYDYKLKSTSTLVNGGSVNYYPRRDRDGVIRPVKSIPDVGAYESSHGTIPVEFTYQNITNTSYLGMSYPYNNTIYMHSDTLSQAIQ